MRVGSLLPRKEVGLDLFFPSQMQENLKVRGVRLGVGGLNTYRQGVGAHLGAWRCRCVCTKAVCGAACASARGEGAWHTLVRVFFGGDARVCARTSGTAWGGVTRTACLLAT